MVRSLGYGVDRIVPLHGRPVTWRAFLDRTGVDKPAFAQPLGLGTPIARLAADPRAKAILDARIPGLFAHPDYEAFKGATLPELAPASQGRITAAMLEAVGADLAVLARR